ncbi:MAG: hypothetical protein IJE43_05515 [Alphaproteobacteria bacterium]|nr:hypothetical protein [Alphaproteobacteria bacterium]
MDWWNILIFGIIPVLTVVIIFVVKRKRLWIAPLVSTALAFITYMIALGIITPPKLLEFFGYSESRGFFILAMLMHLGIVVALTAIAYLVAYLLKRKQK